MTHGTWEIRVGDVLDRLREMPDESVHCIVTSPPYWGLRDYGVAGQIGLEATPSEYLARMVEVFREVRRVLRSDGTCWINIGDSYGTRWASQRMSGRAGFAEGPRARLGPSPAGTSEKNLIGMPWRLAFALQDDGWNLRSEIIWHKPNPMPESVTDRPSKSHEQIFLLSKSRRYFYDQEAVREPQTGTTHPRSSKPTPKSKLVEDKMNRANARFQQATYGYTDVPGGRNARSVWTIATQAFPEAHFATFPEELPRRCILAGTGERGVCPECGAPWRRLRTPNPEYAELLGGTHHKGNNHLNGKQFTTDERTNRLRKIDTSYLTVGWEPSCECGGEPVPATVLDPFAGSGTTVMVALQLGRSGIGIELSPEYSAMARRRIVADAPLFNAEPIEDRPRDCAERGRAIGLQ